MLSLPRRNFFLTEDDVHRGLYIASACAERIQLFNPYATIGVITTALDDLVDKSFLDFDVILLDTCTQVLEKSFMFQYVMCFFFYG